MDANISETSLWRERVRCEMEKIEKKNELEKKHEIVKEWQINRKWIADVCERVTSSEETKKTWVVASPDDMPQQNLSAASFLPPEKCKVFTNAVKNNVQCVPMKVAPVVKPPPTMTTWTPLLRNVRFSQADRQTNIPYLNEEIFEKDNTFILDLEKEYSINEQSTNEGLDEKTFLDLVKGLEQYVDESEQPTEEASDNKSPEKTIVFEAISCYFSGSCTTENLMKRYEDLTAKKENVDVNQNEMSAEEAIQPFKSRICRRCFKYSCDLHKDDPKVDEPIPFKTTPDKTPLPAGDPCGPRCFLYNPRVSVTPSSGASGVFAASGASRISPSGTSRIPAVSGSQVPAQAEWTSAEKMMFRVLVKTFPKDFCTVSKALRTKDCNEVYKFSLQERNISVRKESLTNIQEILSGVSDVKKTAQKDRHRVFKSHHFGGDRDYTKPYRPCHHPGKDCNESCICSSSGNFCEKWCYCSTDCKNRFPGCTCKGNCQTKHCACFRASRECDSDLCQTCGASQYHFSLESASCRNISIQKNMAKKLFVAPSKVAGWGCFIDQDVAKNELIGEYVGEVISDEEAERRGKIYDKSNCSYMFKINDEFVVDAARVGNKLRFANHSDRPNCKPQIVMVNGDHRIGVYAGKNIEKGEELFYDYGNEFHGHGFKK